MQNGVSISDGDLPPGPMLPSYGIDSNRSRHSATLSGINGAPALLGRKVELHDTSVDQC